MERWAIGMSIVALAAGVSIAAGDNRSVQFYDAIRNDDFARLEMLVRSGADVNTKDERGETPLMYSAAVGSINEIGRASCRERV